VSEDSRRSTRDLVRDLLLEGRSVTEIALELGVSKPTGCFHKRGLGVPADTKFGRRYDWAEIRAYYEAGHTMRQCQEEYGFSGAAWGAAVQRGEIEPRPRAAAHEDVFTKGAKRSRFHLKPRLVAAGLKTARCEDCGLAEWRGRPLALELHHVNGDVRDNRVENLRLLCPNCHSQTDTWGGRAKRRRRAA
jgi:hypothetical protein